MSVFLCVCVLVSEVAVAVDIVPQEVSNYPLFLLIFSSLPLLTCQASDKYEGKNDALRVGG